MKYQEALIAWNPNTDQVRVGRFLRQRDSDWSRWPINYTRTGGAAYTGLRECTDKYMRDMMLFIEFHTLVVRDNVPVQAVHRAFLEIDEYRQRISPDIEGADHNGDILGGW